jgi:signal transduction histidine kinase
MRPLEWFQPPRVVLSRFIALMAACALALGWLGWQVLVQDGAVEAQQRQERLERTADLAVAAVERTFDASDVHILITGNDEVEVSPAGRLAYMPASSSRAARDAIFAEAEALEYGKPDRSKAIEVYARLAESGNAQVRAGALVRMGRVMRREHQWSEALRAYGSLEKLGTIAVAGMPASLVARAARCATLSESGDKGSAHRETAALWEQLTAGRWKIGRATLETYIKELEATAPDLALPAGWEERVALSEAAEWAFSQQAPSGRAGFSSGGQLIGVSWERQNGAWSARLAVPGSWHALWNTVERESGLALRVVDSEGRVIHDGRGRGQSAVRAAAMTGLPFNLTVTWRADAPPSGPWNARRRLLIGGLAVFALVLTLGSFLIARAISRELDVARLQTDFVSAVSHEFRTPLTSIRQLTEMLARGRMESERDKKRACDLMLGESDRLRRLVESLLDLGRMQAGQYKFRSENLDAVAWTRAVSGEFQETVLSRGYVIQFTAPSQETRIRGDREALAGALWNLLDNAVKYSPDEKQIRVEVACAKGHVEVRVHDRGSGIGREDLKRIFSKFYRGANAKKQGTKGTGIGLATVKEIVEAHGGTMRVRSEPGAGSEFTMVLPCHES